MDMNIAAPFCDNPKCRFHKMQVTNYHDTVLIPSRLNSIRSIGFNNQEIFPIFFCVRRITRNKFKLNSFNICLTFCSDCEKVVGYIGKRLNGLRVDPSLKFRQPEMMKHLIRQEINGFIDDYYKEQSRTKKYLSWNEMFGNKVKFINCPIHV